MPIPTESTKKIRPDCILQETATINQTCVQTIALQVKSVPRLTPSQEDPRKPKKISAYNAKHEQCAKVTKIEFKEVTKLLPSFSIKYGKKFIRRLITLLKYMPHPINETDGIADILLLTPQGAYYGKVPKAEEYIDHFKDQSAGAIEFAYNTDAAAAGAEMGIKKGIVELVLCLLHINV